MIRKTFLSIGMSILIANPAAATEWGYTGTHGPAHWAALSPDYVMCEAGRNQSPVDIRHALDTDLAPIAFDYMGGVREVVNNGHTVQFNVDPGNGIDLDGHVWALGQFHFHSPSENRIAGRSFPLEAHFVHTDENGHLLVVAVMFEEGSDGKALERLWQYLPMGAGDSASLPTGFTGKPLDMLPTTTGYYRFNGSLTTPPCTEGVVWLVMKDPVGVSVEQLASFRRAMSGHGNNRPVQPLNARIVME